MSRRAVYQALINDTTLNNQGIVEATVFSNYSKDETPVRGRPFLILRWQERPMRGNLQGPQILTVWAHLPREDSTDYAALDSILRRSTEVLTAMEHVDGVDGYIVTSIRATGEGGDLVDPGYNTITKNAAFEVLFRAEP
jgi:hypothetical protein